MDWGSAIGTYFEVGGWLADEVKSGSSAARRMTERKTRATASFETRHPARARTEAGPPLREEDRKKGKDKSRFSAARR